ncbi:conjugal transfer protein [Tetragenococcus halophilus]
MRRIKAYSKIWRIEKVLYKIEDWNLPRPVTFTQIYWFVSLFLAMLLFGKYPPFSFIDSFLIRSFGIPFMGAFLFSRKTYDSKPPHKYLLSMLRYAFVNKESSRSRKHSLKKRKNDEVVITVVEGEKE